MNITELSDRDLDVLVNFRDLLGPFGVRVVDREVQRRDPDGIRWKEARP